MQIMNILNHILLIMELEFLQELNIIELQVKQNLKIIIMYNGQKILQKDKPDISLILEKLK